MSSQEPDMVSAGTDRDRPPSRHRLPSRQLAVAAAITLLVALAASLVVAIRVAGSRGGDVRAARREIAHLRQQLATAARTQHDLDEARATVGQLNAKIAVAGRIVRSTNADKRARVAALRQQFVPSGMRVADFRVIRASAGIPEQIAVVWTGQPNRRAWAPVPGFYLWQRDAEADGAPRWQVIYEMHFQSQDPTAPGDLIIGTPGALTEMPDQWDGDADLQWYLWTSDATGDGHPDVFVTTDTGGSGGCGTWRAIISDGGYARTAMQRSGCDADVAVAHGRLVVTTPVYGKGKDCTVHGCVGWHHDQTYKWDGREFVLVADRVIHDPSG